MRRSLRNTSGNLPDYIKGTCRDPGEVVLTYPKLWTEISEDNGLHPQITVYMGLSFGYGALDVPTSPWSSVGLNSLKSFSIVKSVCLSIYLAISMNLALVLGLQLKPSSQGLIPKVWNSAPCKQFPRP